MTGKMIRGRDEVERKEQNKLMAASENNLKPKLFDGWKSMDNLSEKKRLKKPQKTIIFLLVIRFFLEEK